MEFVIAYWLNWRVLLCVVWILTSIALAIYEIIKYEGPRPRNPEEEEEEEEVQIGVLYENQVWKTCSKKIHPGFLMGYRICVFFLLAILDLLKSIIHGATSFYFYTQWTFTLCYIYFWMGSMFSIYGCTRHRREELDEEQGRPHRVAGFCGYVFQIIYQMLAGVVVLTNCLYWFIIIPVQITTFHTELDLIGKILHPVSIVFFLGEAALNNLPFPWFRIAYFGLWTCVYVVFHWIFHASRGRAFGWPYIFLNLGYPLAPLWYFSVALLHFPCYGVIYLLIKLKQFLLKNLLQDG